MVDRLILCRNRAAFRAFVDMVDTDLKGDTISELPDAVLHQILSFLSTREAARTSVLSTRWRPLWSAVPSLHFYQEEFPRRESLLELVEGAWAARDADVTISTFRLVVSENIDRCYVRRWLENAAERNVEEVEIEVSVGSGDDGSGIVPDYLLRCQSLRSLKLVLPLWKVVFDDGAVGPGSLTTMHLKGIQSCKSSLGTLISSCPVLQELRLEDCYFDLLKITANELKWLTVSRCIFDAYNEVVISTPKLLSFHYTSGKAQGCFIRDMANLVDASIVLFNLSLQNSSVRAWSVSEIFKGLSHASSLTITYLGNQQLSVEEHLQYLPIFLNLKYLRLNILFSRECMEAIAYMLKHMPDLEILVVHNELVWYSIIEEHIWWTSKELTGGMLNRLKEIQLGNFGSSNHETEFIEFLVKNGRIAQDHDGSSLHQK
ncbi:unnamed protein product [Musa acuminata subsp. malaccensis]|nr:unnamed protein product [Musa acuminata subsp. malaccensis]